LCGRYLESLSKARTGDALRELAKTKPSKGLLFIPSDSQKGSSTSTVEVDSDFLEQGDLILVQVGASPPVDAVLLDISGECSFNESSMTGETRPVLKGPGDEVFAGTTNAGPGSCLAKVIREPGSTVLDSIMASVKDAMSKKADIERVADAVTAYFVPAITAIAIFTFLVWMARGLAGNLPSRWLSVQDGPGAWILFAVQFAVAVLVVACPCGIGLAAPTANLIGLGLAAQNGILPQGGGQAFQEFSNIDHLVLDKTGTLTEGRFTVSESLFFLDHTDRELAQIFLWTLISVVEQVSSHPIAEGVSAWCAQQLEESFISLPFSLDLVSSDEVAGQGLKAEIVLGETRLIVHIGNQKMMAAIKAEHLRVDNEAQVKRKLQEWQSLGQSSIQVAVKVTTGADKLPDQLGGLSADQTRIVAVLGIQDPPRREAAHVISYLQKSGIHVWMVSGDNQATARSVGAQVGILPENIVAEALPADKKKFVEDLQAGKTRRKGRKGILSVFRGTDRPLVAFCGDGASFDLL
jgi:Cu+-exporting ATPase